MERARVPEGVIERLSSYLRCLNDLKTAGHTVVSSKKLSMSARVNAAQIRRDLSWFGSFGRRGLGYDVEKLIAIISDILDVKHAHRIALVGAGNLGSAILRYSGLKDQGFVISEVFDNDPKKIGRKIAGVRIKHVDQLVSVLNKTRINIGIIAVPGNSAQAVADKLVEGGVQVLLNYTPKAITVPPEVYLHTTDPAREILHTLYYLTRAPR
jgi:redox-sensing transcriptional repressor